MTDEAALQLLFKHMAKLGYTMENSYGVFFGRTHREFFFDDLALTHAADKHAHLQDWLRQQGLPETLSTDSLRDIENVLSFPEHPPCAVPLLAAYDFGELDQRARQIIAKYRMGQGMPEDLRTCWSSPLWHQPELDTWVDDDWWHEMAVRAQDDMLLTVFGDTTAKERIEKKMKAIADFGWNARFTIYEGESSLEVFLARDYAWPTDDVLDFYDRDNCPPDAQYWLRFFPSLPEAFRQHAAAKLRFWLEPPKSHSDFPDDDYDFKPINVLLRVFRHPEELRLYLTAPLIAVLRHACLKTATEPLPSYFERIDIIEIAHFFGWPEIVDGLAANPSFWELWRDDRSSQCVLSMSLFDRHEVTQRLAAFVLNLSEEDALLREEEIFERFPAYKARMLPYLQSELHQSVILDRRTQLASEKVAAAIAWARSRKLAISLDPI